MDIPTTVTIVEEDGSTSVVDDASIVTEDGETPIQFGQTPSNGETPRQDTIFASRASSALHTLPTTVYSILLSIFLFP